MNDITKKLNSLRPDNGSVQSKICESAYINNMLYIIMPSRVQIIIIYCEEGFNISCSKSVSQTLPNDVHLVVYYDSVPDMQRSYISAMFSR